jgi:hypothetical protein
MSTDKHQQPTPDPRPSRRIRRSCRVRTHAHAAVGAGRPTMPPTGASVRRGAGPRGGRRPRRCRIVGGQAARGRVVRLEAAPACRRRRGPAREAVAGRTPWARNASRSRVSTLSQASATNRPRMPAGYRPSAMTPGRMPGNIASRAMTAHTVGGPEWSTSSRAWAANRSANRGARHQGGVAVPTCAASTAGPSWPDAVGRIRAPNGPPTRVRTTASADRQQGHGPGVEGRADEIRPSAGRQSRREHVVEEPPGQLPTCSPPGPHPGSRGAVHPR